jgi:hypothetical protein
MVENGKVGFIDHSGRVCIAPSYHWTLGFTGPLAKVFLEHSYFSKEAYAYINKKGEIVWQSRSEIHPDR